MTYSINPYRSISGYLRPTCWDFYAKVPGMLEDGFLAD